ncbi:uncharacterized protein LOC125062510 [Pieris napi]|uniref:uncharacterized protein LOC125062510 n=1 Tax=Pieris napi TaxID=78633 RepID=UPI001FBA976E|nr:uncharacterized protein LOC125062510 [Pieris napi]
MFVLFLIFATCAASYNEQYRVPHAASDRWESYIFEDKEYLIQNLPVKWENAKILCRGHHNGTLALIDTKEKAEFLAEALSELQFSIESVWVGARRASSDDPEGYRWSHGGELRRTASDVLPNELDSNLQRHYPMWLNRTHIPVPEGGADCVALERVNHDNPVFLDLPCLLERPFVCEKEAHIEVNIQELKRVRCRSGRYHIFDGRLNWDQAAAYCVIQKMTLANVPSVKCLKKLGVTMLKARPSIESAWVGAKGALGQWTWIDTGLSIFTPTTFTDVSPGWPPMRDGAVKQSGCLQIDRHETLSPIFMEARCERKMQFICYQGLPGLRTTLLPQSDDNYYYILVRQSFYWHHALENCKKMNGSLASVENNDVLIQLLLAMGENKEEPVEHVWISGHLNMTRENDVIYSWWNPNTGKRIPDPKNGDTGYMPPWLDEEFSMDSPCLNLDRQDHLNGVIYGLPCDTPQYSICMIEKTTKTASDTANEDST